MIGKTQNIGGVYFAASKFSAWGWLIALLLLVAGMGFYVLKLLGYIENWPPELGLGLVLVGSVLTLIWICTLRPPPSFG